MNLRQTSLQRAFELVRSGKCVSVGEIIERLKSERDNDDQVQGAEGSTYKTPGDPTMSYQIVENTSEGFIVHDVDNAEAALSLWFGLDGEASAIRDEHHEAISLTELIISVAANRLSERSPTSGIEVEDNEDLEVEEGKERTSSDPI
jgi:hypothetical protein